MVYGRGDDGYGCVDAVSGTERMVGEVNPWGTMAMHELHDTGYVRDVAFRSGVVPGQSPAVMAYAALTAGFVPADWKDGFDYLDLGCGEGSTLLALAALFPQGRFYGVDFNPTHVAAATQAARELDLGNVEVHEAAFTDLPRLPLPERFQFIGCNGIYGWLDPKNAAALDAFVGRRLAEGGLFYVEYLSSPGKIAIAALWRFLQEMAPLSDFEGDARARAEAALGWLERLARRGMFFFQQHPTALAAARHYLTGAKRDRYQIDHFAHNAMAAHFTPRSFCEVHGRFAAQGLCFAARADLELNDLELAVPPAQVPTFRELTDPVRREVLKDFIRNEHDRRDVWIKGGVRDEAAALKRLAEGYGLLLRMPPERILRQVAAPGGHRVALVGAAYEAILERAYAAPVRLADLGSEQDWGRFRRAFERLIASGQAFLVTDREFLPQPATAVAENQTAPLRLAHDINAWLVRRGAERLTGSQLVARATGGLALVLSPLETLLLAEAATGGPAGAVAAATARLAQAAEQPVLCGPGFKPAREVTPEELSKVLSEFLATKAVNLARLGLTLEAAS